MIELQGNGLTPDTIYTASAQHGDDRLPMLSFTTDPTGAVPQALAFTKFIGVYDIESVQVQPGG